MKSGEGGRKGSYYFVIMQSLHQYVFSGIIIYVSKHVSSVVYTIRASRLLFHHIQRYVVFNIAVNPFFYFTLIINYWQMSVDQVSKYQVSGISPREFCLNELSKKFFIKTDSFCRTQKTQQLNPCSTFSKHLPFWNRFWTQYTKKCDKTSTSIT